MRYSGASLGGYQAWVKPPWVDGCSIATPQGPGQSGFTRTALVAGLEQGGLPGQWGARAGVAKGNRNTYATVA